MSRRRRLAHIRAKFKRSVGPSRPSGTGGGPGSTPANEITWDDGDLMAWDDGDFVAWDD